MPIYARGLGSIEKRVIGRGSFDVTDSAIIETELTHCTLSTAAKQYRIYHDQNYGFSVRTSEIYILCTVYIHIYIIYNTLYKEPKNQ